MLSAKIPKLRSKKIYIFLVLGPVAVGVALMSSMEMVANGLKGRGVRITHVFGDFLWFAFRQRIFCPGLILFL